MALSAPPRQPLGALSSSRLHGLDSIHNRHTRASVHSLSSPLKPTHACPQKTPSSKRRFSLSVCDDAENVDPVALASPTKRAKTAAVAAAAPSPTLCSPTPMSPSAKPVSTPVGSTRKALASSRPAASTSAGRTRGTPKHKRVGALSKRRVSSSPCRRVDPPSLAPHSSPGLPFSIDAAISGTLAPASPKPAPVAAPAHVPLLEDAMPRSWFFDIHEDTPEQEATNLMEHSALVLDISSEDDDATKRRNDALDRGKENVPPPDYVAATQAPADNAARIEDARCDSVAEPRSKRTADVDAMDQDRSPLSDLRAADFYAPGLDASSHVVVDAGADHAGADRPSLSKQLDADPSTAQVPVIEEEVQVHEDAPAKEQDVCADEKAMSGAHEEHSLLPALAAWSTDAIEL